MNLNVSFELSKAGKLRKWVDHDAGEVHFNMMMLFMVMLISMMMTIMAIVMSVSPSEIHFNMMMLLMVDVDFVDFDDDGDSDMGLT